MVEAKVIVVNEETGEAYFEQGDVRFPVDGKSLERVLGAASFSEDGSVLDKLMDSTIMALAVMNDLPHSPFDRQLLRHPLHGVIQIAWMRGVNRTEPSEYVMKNQVRRVEKYKRDLLELASRPPEEGESRGARKAEKLQRGYRLAPKADPQSFRGRERALLQVMREIGDASYAQIVEACREKVKTAKLERFVTWALSSLARRGAVQVIEE